MGQNNRASRAPTKYDIRRKTQLLMDIEYDRREYQQYTQIGEEEWISWNFYVRDDMTIMFPWTYKALYHHVRTLTIKRKDEKLFVHCDCLKHKSEGVPCRCFYGLFGTMATYMVNIQHLKAYSPHYGYQDKLGDKLIDAQSKQDNYEGYGVPITEELLKQVTALNADKQFPYLFNGTSYQDYEEAQFVLRRRTSTVATLHSDLARYKRGDTSVNDESIAFGNIAALSDYHVSLSEKTQALHEKLERAGKRCSPRYGQTLDQKKASRKRISSTIDAVLNHPDACVEDAEYLEEEVKRLKREIVSRNNRRKSGDVGVGEESPHREMIVNNENASTLGDNDVSQDIEVNVGDEEAKCEVDDGMEWACTTSRVGEKETRMKNSLN